MSFPRFHSYIVTQPRLDSSSPFFYFFFLGLPGCLFDIVCPAIIVCKAKLPDSVFFFQTSINGRLPIVNSNSSSDLDFLQISLQKQIFSIFRNISLFSGIMLSTLYEILHLILEWILGLCTIPVFWRKNSHSHVKRHKRKKKKTQEVPCPYYWD